MAGYFGVAESFGDTPQDIDFARRQLDGIERLMACKARSSLNSVIKPAPASFPAAAAV
jgi:hypothetical protein